MPSLWTATKFEKVGSAVACTCGTMDLSAVSGWFNKLCPSESTGEDWESFKLGYIAGLLKKAEELAVPVWIIEADSTPLDDTGAVGFATFVYILGQTGRLELLDFQTEIMP